MPDALRIREQLKFGPAQSFVQEPIAEQEQVSEGVTESKPEKVEDGD